MALTEENIHDAVFFWLYYGSTSSQMVIPGSSLPNGLQPSDSNVEAYGSFGLNFTNDASYNQQLILLNETTHFPNVISGTGVPTPLIRNAPPIDTKLVQIFREDGLFNIKPSELSTYLTEVSSFYSNFINSIAELGSLGGGTPPTFFPNKIGNKIWSKYNASSVPCFLKGTFIKTETDMDVKIESLKIGDRLKTHDGRDVPILSIKNFESESEPYELKKDSIVNGFKVTQDLYLSEDHAIMINDQLLRRVKYLNYEHKKINPDNKYEYYHIVTPNFYTDVILANGVPCETYGNSMKEQCDKNPNLGFLMRNLFYRLFTNGEKMDRFYITHQNFKDLYNKIELKNNYTHKIAEQNKKLTLNC